MNKAYAIGIPTLNRADLLLPSLISYKEDFPNTRIFVIDNGMQPLLDGVQLTNPNVTLIRSGENLGVAASWNMMCKLIFSEGIPNAFILNDDVYFGGNESLMSSYLFCSDNRHLHTNPIDWSAFILPKATFERIGEFDEQFYPAYCEDNDYAYRMKLANFAIRKTPFLIPIVHRSSQTLEKDTSIANAYRVNKKRYIEKWGGQPDFEVFKKPYNK